MVKIALCGTLAGPDMCWLMLPQHVGQSTLSPDTVWAPLWGYERVLDRVSPRASSVINKHKVCLCFAGDRHTEEPSLKCVCARSCVDCHL